VKAFNDAFKAKRNIHGKENEHYPKIVNKLVEKYNSYMNVKYTLNTFIDLMTRAIVPPDTYSEIYDDSVTKADIVRIILVKTLNEFTVFILTKEFESAISLETRQAKDPDILRQVNLRWKEHFKSILSSQRSEYYSLLIAKRNGVDINKQNQNDLVPIEIVRALESKLRDSLSEKNKILQERNKMADYARLLIDRVKELETYVEELERPNTVIQQTPVVNTNQRSIQQPTSNRFMEMALSKPVNNFIVNESQSDDEQEPAQNSVAVSNTIPVSNITPVSKPVPKPIPKPIPKTIQKSVRQIQEEPTLDELPSVQAMNVKYDSIDIKPAIAKRIVDTTYMEEIDPVDQDDQEDQNQDDQDKENQDQEDQNQEDQTQEALDLNDEGELEADE
jgi:hypothetical protein